MHAATPCRCASSARAAGRGMAPPPPPHHARPATQSSSMRRRPVERRRAQQQRRQIASAAPAPLGELADAAAVALEGAGVLGIAAGGLCVALWNIEKQSSQRLGAELAAAQEQLQQQQRQLAEAQQLLQEERQLRQAAQEWKPRLDDAQTELFKLERALELKDAQLATFMTTAHRQIRSLEDSVKELQKMP